MYNRFRGEKRPGEHLEIKSFACLLDEVGCRGHVVEKFLEISTVGAVINMAAQQATHSPRDRLASFPPFYPHIRRFAPMEPRANNPHPL